MEMPVVRWGDAADAAVLAGEVGDGGGSELAAAFAEDDDEVGVLGAEDGLEAAPVGEGGFDVFLGDLIGIGIGGRDAGLGIYGDGDGSSEKE